jgi:tetratricopeptide (TPR) repeat protein
MIKKRLLVLIGLVLLLTVPSIAQNYMLTGACPGDEDEEEFTVGDTISGRLREDEILWFTFTGEENDIWRIEMLSEDENEFFVGILNPELRLLEDFDEDNLFFSYNISDSPATSAFLSQIAGVYCVILRNESNDTVNYEISLEPFPRNNDGELRNVDELDSYGLNEVGNWYYYQNNFAASLEAYELALELEPDDFIILGNACGSAYLLGDYEDAIDFCDESIDLEPNAYAYWNRAIAYQSLGDYDEATDDFDELIDLEPDNGTAYYDRSVNALLNGDYEDALDDMEEAFDMGISSDLYWLAIAQLFAGELDDAQESFESSVEDYADDDLTAPFHNFWLGVIADVQGESRREIEGFLETALDESSTIEAMSETRVLALVALVQDDMESAQSYYQEVLDESNLPHNRVNDLVYLKLLSALYPDNLTFFAMLDWFEAELGF